MTCVSLGSWKSKLVFSDIWRCHQKVSPEDATRRCHQKVSPEDATRRCHQKVSPENVTRRCHQKMSPENVTRTWHQNMSPADVTRSSCLTQQLHQISPELVATIEKLVLAQIEDGGAEHYFSQTMLADVLSSSVFSHFSLLLLCWLQILHWATLTSFQPIGPTLHCMSPTCHFNRFDFWFFVSIFHHLMTQIQKPPFGISCVWTFLNVNRYFNSDDILWSWLPWYNTDLLNIETCHQALKNARMRRFRLRKWE